MSKTEWVRAAIALSITGMMLLPFTNCGKYADPANEELYSQSLEECDDDCINPKADNLTVKPNVGGGNEYSVPASLTEFNLGGDCNEGGYASNIIRWELFLNGVMVRHSGMLGMAGAVPVHSRCINGRFLLYMNLSAINEDPVDRTGLKTGVSLNRGAYDLYIEIYGMRQITDPAPVRNPIKGRARLSLSAI